MDIKSIGSPSFFTLIAFLVFIENAQAIQIIKDDATGGDCEKIGTWNQGAKTCVLNQDLDESVVIADEGITFDGDNNEIVGNGQGNGIEVRHVKRVKIKNTKISKFIRGINIKSGGDHWIEKNVFSGLGAGAPQGRFASGIVVERSSGNWIGGNTFKDLNSSGVQVSRASNNIVYDNTFNNVFFAVYFTGVKFSNVEDNKIQGVQNTAGKGIVILDSKENNIFSNKIKDLTAGPGIESIGVSSENIYMFNEIENTGLVGFFNSGTESLFVCNDLNLHGNTAIDLFQGAVRNELILNNLYTADDASDPNGNLNSFSHNHWQVQQNCPDINGDGICEVPHVFPNNVDPFPLKNLVPWKQNPEVCFPSIIGNRDDKPIHPYPNGFDARILGTPATPTESAAGISN